MGARRKTPEIVGLTVGHAVAIKMTDRRGKESTRLGLVFNEQTDKPEVLLLPKSLEISSIQLNLAEAVADKVRRFPAHMAKIVAERAAEKEEELKASTVEEI